MARHIPRLAQVSAAAAVHAAIAANLAQVTAAARIDAAIAAYLALVTAAARVHSLGIHRSNTHQNSHQKN